MTAIANLPDLRPSLLLDFANSGRVDPRIQCTRASAATCFGPDGKLRTVAANVPRIDYDPATGKCLGLLVEEARTNLFSRSEAFASNEWSKSGAVIAIEPGTNPDGSLGCEKLVESQTNAPHHFRRDNVSVKSGTGYTFTIFVKPGGREAISVAMSASAFGSNNCRFDFVAKTAVVTAGAGFASLQEVGNGWFRCSYTATAIATAIAGFTPQVALLGANNSTNYEGDGISGVYVWGAQFEVGIFPTTYIPTDASAVTRAADQYLVPSSYFLNDVEGTFVGKFVTYAPALSYNKTVFSLIESGVANNISVVYSATNSVLASDIRAEGMFQHAPSSPVSQGEWYRRALTWKQGFARSATNGDLTGGQSSSVEVPKGLTTLFVGSRLGQNFLCGHLHSLVYFSKAVTNEQLQRISAL